MNEKELKYPLTKSMVQGKQQVNIGAKPDLNDSRTTLNLNLNLNQ